MTQRSDKVVGQLDWTLIGLYLLLALLGIVNLYSAAFNEAHPSLFDLSQEYGKQTMWFGACIVIGAIILLIDSHIWNRFSYHVYGVVCFLLLCVLLFGAERNGAKSWFGVGSFGIQPSEFAKFGTALAVAFFLSKSNSKVYDIKTAAVIMAIIGMPALLILLQPDAGTLLVFVGFVLVLYREGLSGNFLLLGLFSVIVAVLSLIAKDSALEITSMDWIIPGQFVLSGIIVLLGTALFFLIRRVVFPRYRRPAYIYLFTAIGTSVIMIFSVNWAFEKLLLPHQQDRIEITLGLKVNKDQSYNRDQALKAIASGRLVGKGYHEGTLSNNKYKWVPMQSTDFIFCSVGEEWGFLGTLLVLSIFITLLVRVVMLAERQRSRFSRIYGYAVASILFMHLLINVGMAIGLAPIIGIPLPFFSYGGSSLIGFTILIFIFIKLDSDRLEVLR